ncbi:beta-1,3-galactosyltransferase 1-like [Oculina patagonica]
MKNESNSLLKEDKVHGDLVRADYFDNYRNQTLKIQMGFEWATRYCKFSFLLKADDDVFVNSAQLLSFLSDPTTTPKQKLYMGIHRKRPLVQRRGKWKVTKEEYSDSVYPPFCPGFGFVLSHDVAITFVKAFDFVPYYRMDDVYVGMLAKQSGIKITHNAGFEMDAPKQCMPNEGTLVRHGFYKRDGAQEDCLVEIFKRASKVLK